MCCLYIYLLQKDTRTFAKSFACLIFCGNLKGIQMYCNYSSAFLQVILCEQNIIPMCDFMFMQHNSHSDKVSL